jgi:hypothetical protein
LQKEGLDVSHHVVVAGIVLHRSRIAEHVHQAAVDACLGDHVGDPGIGAKSGHIVDVRRARLERSSGHGALRGVDRDLRPGSRGHETLDHRQHPA